MEDIQINEQALLEWQQKYKKDKPKVLTWIDNLYNKVNLSISRYFRKVSWNFEEWKYIMTMENEEIKSLYESRRLLYKSTSLYFPTGLSAYFCADGYVRYRTAYELENDIITQETLDKMGDRLSTEIQNRITANAWNTYWRYYQNESNTTS